MRVWVEPQGDGVKNVDIYYMLRGQYATPGVYIVEMNNIEEINNIEEEKCFFQRIWIWFLGVIKFKRFLRGE
jgi:hypothetical protein